MDAVAVVRAIVGAVVGGFLIVYAAVARTPNRAILIGLGLILLGVVTVDGLIARRPPP